MTVRRSRDRLSAAPSVQPKSPEELTLRLPKRRERDVRYSIESDTASRGAVAFTYRKQHGKEIQESHLRDRGVSFEISPGSDLNPSPVRDDQDLPQGSRKDRFHFREFNSPPGLPRVD